MHGGSSCHQSGNGLHGVRVGWFGPLRRCTNDPEVHSWRDSCGGRAVLLHCGSRIHVQIMATLSDNALSMGML